MADLRRLRGRFGRKVDLPEQRLAYHALFAAGAGKRVVLADLLEFCGYADPAPAAGDLFTQGRAAGRRDVALRILSHLRLSDEELYALLKGQPLPVQQPMD